MINKIIIHQLCQWLLSIEDCTGAPLGNTERRHRDVLSAPPIIANSASLSMKIPTDQLE